MTDTPTPLLVADALDVVFDTYRGPHQVLHRVSFRIAPGEILGVVGESGAGKSMTGLAVAGLIESPGRLAHGSVTLEGQRIDTLQGEAIRRLRGRRIGMVFQDPLTSLNPVLTIGQQLTETIRTHLPLSERQATERALALLAEVEIPQPEWRLSQYPHQLSGGMRQRVAIALALCADPCLLIADEPTTALDVSVQAQVIALLRRLCRQRGLAAMLITHDMGVIAETADRVMVMYGGRVLETGPVRQVLQHPRHAYTRALMAAIPSVTHRQQRLPVPGVDAKLGGMDGLEDASAGRARQAMAESSSCHLSIPVVSLGHAGEVSPGTSAQPRLPGAAQASPVFDKGSMPRVPPTSAPEARDPSAADPSPVAAVDASLLVVENLSRRFDLSSGWLQRLILREPKRILQAVDNVGFTIARGRTFGLVGESGSGKSTVARMVAGLLRPDDGRIVFEGIDRWSGDAARLPAEQRLALRRRCQMIFQDPYASLNPRWRVARLIAEPLHVLGLATDRDEIEARVIDMLRHVRMSPDDARKYPHQFSGGQRQRIAIACALISQPDFIICDEPTSALDVSVQAQVLNLMRDLQDEYGLTYLLISHDLSVIRFMCDDIGVMQQGRMVEQGRAQAVLDDPQDPYTRQLLAAIPSLGSL